METLDFMVNLVRQNIAIPTDGAILASKDPSWRSYLTMIVPFSRPPWGTPFFAEDGTDSPSKGQLHTTQFGWGYFVPNTAQYPEEAWKFLEWYTMKQTSDGMTWLGKALALRYVPTNPIDMRVVRQQMVTEPFWEGFIRGMDYSKPEPAFPQIFKRWELIGAALQPVMRLQRPPLEGLREAQDQYQRS